MQRAILSVAHLQDSGYVVQFGGKQPYLERSRYRVPIIRVAGLYYLPVWRRGQEPDMTDMQQKWLRQMIGNANMCPVVSSHVLFEICCSPTSRLAQWYLDHDHMAFRAKLPESDMREPQVVQRVLGYIAVCCEAGNDVSVWMSYPCDP